eukprot:3575968-Alexandrium_andersonii.AAC.1
MEQQPPVRASDSSDDPLVVPLNLPVDGTAPVFAGPPAGSANPWRNEFYDRTSTPAGEAGPVQSRYGPPLVGQPHGWRRPAGPWR